MAENNSAIAPRGPVGWLDYGIELIESFILATAVIAMALLGITNVIARNVFGNSLAFTEESNQMLLVMVTFMGVGYAARQGRHIRMSAFHDMLSVNGRKILLIVTSVLTGALLLYLAWYALDYALATMQRGRVTPAMRMPLWFVYAWVPFGLLIGAIQFFLAAFRNIISPGAHLAFHKPDEMAESPELRSGL